MAVVQRGVCTAARDLLRLEPKAEPAVVRGEPPFPIGACPGVLLESGELDVADQRIVGPVDLEQVVVRERFFTDVDPRRPTIFDVVPRLHRSNLERLTG